MNRILLAGLSCMSLFFLSAQSTISVTIEDAVTLKPIEAATVLITGNKTTVADENGRFSLNRQKTSGTLQLQISAAGYEPKDTTFTPAKRELVIYLVQKQLLLQPVEVNAVRAGERSPFTRTNLTKSYIEKNNLGQDLPFILNQVPNVVVNSDAGNGVGYTGIRIRGTDATRINMTINGIPYNDAESQGTYFVDLPDFASSVTSAQVQRGVGTSSNGAGAFGASMNFSTSEYNETPYNELNNSYGSFNTWKNTVKLGSGLLGKHFTFDGRYSNVRSDGFIDRAKTNLESGYLSAGYWGKKTSLRFNVILGKEKTYQAWNGVPETLLQANRTYNSAGTEKPGDPYSNETDNYRQDHYQFLWNQQVGNSWNFNTALFYSKGRGYYEQYKADRKLSDYGILPLISGMDTTRRTDLVRRLWLDNNFYGQVFSFQQKRNRHQVTIGGGWNEYKGNHFGEVIWSKVKPSLFREYYRVDAKKNDVNLYVKWQQQLCENIELFADLQYRQVNYTINGFRDNPDVKVQSKYDFINPKIGASYRKENWSGFVSFAMANKEPNRDDFEAGKTQQPKQEQLNDLELNIKRSNLLAGLDLAATFYGMFYKNQLVLTGKINDVGAYTRSNIPQSYRTGLELEANYHSRKWNLAYSLSLSRNKIKNFTEYADDYDNGGQQVVNHGTTDISFSPTSVQNLTLNVIPVNNLEFTWLGKQVGKQFLDNTSSNLRSLDGYLVNDLRAAYTVNGKWVKQVRFFVQVNNIFNVKYEPNGYTFSYISGGAYSYENYYFPMAGTNLIAGINLKF